MCLVLKGHVTTTCNSYSCGHNGNPNISSLSLQGGAAMAGNHWYPLSIVHCIPIAKNLVMTIVTGQHFNAVWAASSPLFPRIEHLGIRFGEDGGVDLDISQEFQCGGL